MGVRHKYILLFLALSCFLAAAGCALFQGMGGPQSQAAKKAFETRMIDAKYNDVYAAALESMFDLGYTISHTDKVTGIVVGEKNQQRYVNTSGMTDAEKRLAENAYDTLQLTILVKEAGAKETAVRIKTAWNKEESFQKNAIDQVWVYIQRQVMMEDTPKKPLKGEK